MNDLEANLEELKHENAVHYQFVIERSKHDNDKAALLAMGRTESWLWRQENKAELQQLANDLRGDRVAQVKLKYDAIALKAAETVEELLDAKDERVRLQAAQDVLNRLGVKVADKLDISIGMSSRTIEEVVMLAYGKAQAKQLVAGSDSPDVVDGEYQAGESG